MAAHRARIRGNIANLNSHFEQSLNELNSVRRGTAGRSASVQTFLEEDDENDALRETFILRKATLTQEQWNKYLSPEKAKVTSDVSVNGSESSALLTRKDLSCQSAGSGEGPVVSRKSCSFDLETGAAVDKATNRSRQSVFFLPLCTPWDTPIMIWTQIILFLDLTYTAFLVPLLVGFEVSDVDWGWGCIIDFIAGFLFTFEFFVNFHVGFIGKSTTRRRLIMDGKAIAWYYITQGHFFVDALTAIVWIAQVVFIILYNTGIHSLDDGVATKVYQAVRVLRLVRFTSLLRRLYATAAVAQQTILPGLHVSHAVANFFNLVFGGLVLANFLSCLWNFTAIAEGFEGTWINLYSVLIREYGSADSQSNGALTSEEASAIPGPRRYLAGIYFTLVTIGTVGYGDIYPQTVPEEFIAMFIICMGLVFFGIILGSIAEALQRLSQDAKQAVLFRGRMESVDKWMSNRKLPMRLRNKIANYYAEDWLYGADAGEEVQVMTELPQGLRKEIALSINGPLFKKLNFFNNFPDNVVSAIASHMSPLQLPAGFELCEEEDLADCFWILHDGEVAAISYIFPDRNATLKAPALVGQVAILQEQKQEYIQRQCSYRTHTSCLLWEVPLREVLVLLRQHPNLYQLASQQALPRHYFDYLAINPAATFLADEAEAQAMRGSATKDVRFSTQDGVSAKELNEEKTIASMGKTSAPSLSQKSGASLGPRGSQGVTRSELKRAELKRAKSMAR